MKVVDECPDNRFAQFIYCWDWEKPVHILGGLIVHKHNYVNAFGTKQSVHNIVDDRFSGHLAYNSKL